MKPSLYTIKDYYSYAKQMLPKAYFDYISSGSGDEETLNQNTQSFSKYKILPRVMIDVSKVSTSINILGHELSAPIIIAPMATHKLVHNEGEIGMFGAAADQNVGATLSTLSSVALEDVAKVFPTSLKLFQLYLSKDRSIAKSLLHRAETSGYSAIVLTVDGPVMGDS